MRQRLHELISDRRGATAVEYGLILAVMTLVVLLSMTSVADGAIAMWNHVSSTVTSAIDG